VDNWDKRSTRSAKHSTVKQRRKLEHSRIKKLSNKPGHDNSVASPAPAQRQATATTPHTEDYITPDIISPGAQPDLSEISENDLDEPWDEAWIPATQDSYKLVFMPQHFNTPRRLAPRTSFTGPGTVTPGHRSLSH
jgi:hypothetical protein